MSTKNKTTKKARSTTKATQTKQSPVVLSAAAKEAIANGTLTRIAENLIEFSPSNYRSSYSEKALQEFAENLRQNDLISSLLVRPIPDGKYQLVAGERRLRAGRIAGLATVPVNIVDLSDDQVLEVQLSENLQREDPHPLRDADAIARMSAQKLSIEEIGVRISKSKSFVYTRLKLSRLIDPFREMFLADKLNIVQASDIATLDSQSQQEFFDEQCNDWKEQEDFDFEDISHFLQQYECDLSNAPFDTLDSTLLPHAGACTTCPHNSATLTSLFPDMAEEAICHNKPCYQQKCEAFTSIEILNLYTEHHPQAILLDYYVANRYKGSLKIIPQDLPHYEPAEYDIEQAPQAPDRADYTEMDEDGESEIFDDAGFELAVEEYKSELDVFNQQIAAGTIQKGLCLRGTSVKIVYFSLSSDQEQGSVLNTPTTITVTAKSVQEALKEGKATPEMLRAEINRINQTEKRAQELDREKIQLATHEQFDKGVQQAFYNECTPADLTAARYLIYRSLDYTRRQAFKELLLGAEVGYSEPEDFYKHLRDMDSYEYAYLIRLALLSQSDSKIPGTIMAEALTEAATHAGVPVTVIEQGQQSKADTRQERKQVRILLLEKKIAKLEQTEQAMLQS